MPGLNELACFFKHHNPIGKQVKIAAISGLDTTENPGIYEKYMHSGQIACNGKKYQGLIP
jgi:hypothetical protein